MEPQIPVKPLHDRLLVKYLYPLETPKAVVIPDAYKDGTIFAVVAAIGPKVQGVKAGDVVVCPGVGLRQPDVLFDEYILIQQGDIAGIVEGMEA